MSKARLLDILQGPENELAGHVLSGWNTLIAQLVKIAEWTRVS
jgi:hypothetical protein